MIPRQQLCRIDKSQAGRCGSPKVTFSGLMLRRRILVSYAPLRATV